MAPIKILVIRFRLLNIQYDTALCYWNFFITQF